MLSPYTFAIQRICQDSLRKDLKDSLSQLHMHAKEAYTSVKRGRYFCNTKDSLRKDLKDSLSQLHMHAARQEETYNKARRDLQQGNTKDSPRKDSLSRLHMHAASRPPFAHHEPSPSHSSHRRQSALLCHSLTCPTVTFNFLALSLSSSALLP